MPFRTDALHKAGEVLSLAKENLGNLRESTTITPSDLPLFGLTCLVYLIWRLFLSKLILPWIGRVTKVEKKQMFKFIHRGFDCIHYFTSTTIGLLALHDKEYFKCCFWAQECGEMFAQTPDGFRCTGWEKLYYFVFCAYYAVDVLFLFTTPKDLFFMGLHHAITVGMIGLSVVVRVPVIGLVIMLLHDFVDVPIYLGKVLTYMKVRILKDIALLSFGVFLVYFRLINLPQVIYHCWKNTATTTFKTNLYIFNWSMLIVLMICHLHWFHKTVQAIIKVIKVGEKAITDPRSDEGNDEDEEGKKNK